MAITKPASGDIIPVARGNAYSIGTTAPTNPSVGDMWADTSYANPPGPQLKVYTGTLYGWQVWKASFLDAKQIVATYASIGTSFSANTYTISGLSIPASSGIEIVGGYEIKFTGGATTAGCASYIYDVLLNGTAITSGSAVASIQKSNTTAYTGSAWFNFSIYIPRRDGGFPTANRVGTYYKYMMVRFGVSAVGGAGTSIFSGSGFGWVSTQPMPTVSITSVAIKTNNSGSIPGGDLNLALYEWDEGG